MSLSINTRFNIRTPTGVRGYGFDTFRRAAMDCLRKHTENASYRLWEEASIEPLLVHAGYVAVSIGATFTWTLISDLLNNKLTQTAKNPDTELAVYFVPEGFKAIVVVDGAPTALTWEEVSTKMNEFNSSAQDEDKMNEQTRLFESWCAAIPGFPFSERAVNNDGKPYFIEAPATMSRRLKIAAELRQTHAASAGAGGAGGAARTKTNEVSVQSEIPSLLGKRGRDMGVQTDPVPTVHHPSLLPAHVHGTGPSATRPLVRPLSKLVPGAGGAASNVIGQTGDDAADARTRGAKIVGGGGSTDADEEFGARMMNDTTGVTDPWDSD